MEPAGSPRGPQNQGISVSFRVSSPGPPQRRKMDPQHDPKMESKWLQNGVNIEPKTNEKLVKNQVEIFAFFESSYQVSKRVFNDITKLFV